MEIKHVGHKHRLTVIELKDVRYCSACRDICTDPMYGCSKCEFFLHKSCAERPQEFRNPFHPHPLTLVIKLNSLRLCDACFGYCLGFNYCCKLCNIVLDLKCAFYMPTIQADKQLQHSKHFHALELIDQKDDNDDRVYCSVCTKICSGQTFCCISCRVFLHKSCAELQLPEEIHHFFHPCTLSFSRKEHGNCRACNISLVNFSYCCVKCIFHLDAECALMPNTIKSDCEQQLLQHFTHGHPLKLCVKKEDDQVQCSACEKSCSGQIYVCDRCKFFLHESCVGLAPEIRHPFHPSHSFKLRPEAPEFYSRCKACGIQCEGFTYFCEQCRFHLHIGCSELLPTIQYEGHNDHLLTFTDKIDAYMLQCSSCNLFCGGSPVFRCAQCDFTLHLLCGPLPCTIKDKCHIHPFTLTDSPIEDVDWNGFCCDVCENERDPRPGIYYCEECNYIAEIACVISEVFLTLKGEYGDAELRASYSQITGKVVSKSNKNEEIKTTTLTLCDLLKSFTEGEKSELNGVLKAARKETNGTRKILSEDQNRDNDSIIEDNADSIPEALLFSDKYYKQFLEKLDFGPTDSIILWEEAEEIVVVQDSMVTRSLAPILEELYAKYENISADSTLRPRVKIYFNIMLCGTIDSMLKTKFEDVNKNLLSSWWKYLKTLQFGGFKIQFALDHLKKVVHAYLGNFTRQEVEKVFTELDTNISEISDGVEYLTIQLEAMKAELEALKEKQRLFRSTQSANSSLLEECLMEASKFKCRTAGEGLL